MTTLGCIPKGFLKDIHLNINKTTKYKARAKAWLSKGKALGAKPKDKAKNVVLFENFLTGSTARGLYESPTMATDSVKVTKCRCLTS